LQLFSLILIAKIIVLIISLSLIVNYRNGFCKALTEIFQFRRALCVCACPATIWTLTKRCLGLWGEIGKDNFSKITVERPDFIYFLCYFPSKQFKEKQKILNLEETKLFICPAKPKKRFSGIEIYFYRLIDSRLISSRLSLLICFPFRETNIKMGILVLR